ncbi:MAG: DUF4434 domain-containing protein [Desulfovibrio sp.]
MASAFRRIVPALLCLLALLGPTRPAAAETPRFTGTFLQLLADHASWDAARWQALFASLRAIDVDEVVVQWSVNDKAPTYQSEHFTAPPNLSLPAVLQAARASGMHLVLGLVHDPAYWEKIKRDPKLVRVYFRRLLLESLAAAKELAALTAGDPTVVGYYIPQEIDDRSWLEPARQDVLVEYLTDLREGLRQIAPGLPVAVSGFSNAFAEPLVLRRLWTRILGASGIDRVLFQDGVGVAKLLHGETGIFLTAVSQAAQETGRAFTPVVETFTQVAGPPINDKPFQAIPAPLERLKKQLDTAGRLPHDGIVAFSLPEYCSPFAGPAAAALYAQYKGAFIH